MNEYINIKLASAWIILLQIFSFSATAQIITTIAGTATAGYNGDSILAVTAQINSPRICVSPAGNVYIADYGNNRVRHVDAAGMITTIAGNGSPGYSGDGTLAINAEITPSTIAVDQKGDIYINIADKHRICKIDAVTGIISTIAGTGAAGYSGDGGPAINAKIDNAAGIAFDTAGNLFFSDAHNRRIRKVDMKTGIITTFAGNGGFGFSGDGGPAVNASFQNRTGQICFDSKNNLYIVANNTRIRKVDAVTGIINTIAGTGSAGWGGNGRPATSTAIGRTYGIAVNSKGDLYLGIALSTYRICKIDAATGVLTTVAGSSGTKGFSGDGGPAMNAEFNYAHTLACDANDNLYIGDIINAVVRKVYFNPVCEVISTGTISSSAGDSFCSEGITTLSLKGALPATGLNYEWWSSTDSVGWSLADTTATITVDINKTTYYKCILKCPTGNNRDSTAAYTVVVSHPTDFLQTLSVCSNDFPLLWNGISVSDSGDSVATYLTKNSNGCDSTVILNVTVGNTDSTTEKVTVCKEDLPIIWNEIVIPETALTNSNYVNYYGINAIGCDSIVTLDLTVNQNCGATKVDLIKEADNKIILYPNPNKGTFTVEITTNEDYAMLQITNVMGRVLFRQEIQPLYGKIKRQIQLDQVSPGIYFLNLASKKDNQTIRFLIVN